MQPSNYFFSYSRKDSDFVKRLATDLKNAGANVWLDQLDIAPGNPWDDSIQNALNAAQGLIVILSNDSVKSKNVMDEVSYAMSQGKKIMPLMIENCPIPFRLARLQYIDYMGDYDSSFAHLLQTLKTLEPSLVQPSKSEIPVLPKSELKTNSVKPVITFSAVILILLLIIFVLFNNNKSSINASTATVQNIKTEQFRQTYNPPTTSGKDVEEPSQSIEQNDAPKDGRINLLSLENGAQILVASNDKWEYTIDGKEKKQCTWSELGEAVYGFKNDRSATFDTFTMLISATGNDNVREFELLTSNNTLSGPFKSIGKFETQNAKLFKTPYQEFKFVAVTAKYLKVKLLSTYGPGFSYIEEFQLFGSLK